ncbi:glycosyltransferase family 4 protein [Sphingomonas flavalba]|uniref:glycosyltransferase family 4 protein n=1 Tax=Sphingomonas flavalba TaxID=2559804 RepID=UPI00109E2038|nr:glycosyltransferase family 4 protein [Sphingomonas flavalba]
MAQRILYLSQWFLPENSDRGLRIAKALIERGYEVEALTGFPNYPTGKIAPGYTLRPYMRETLDGLTVHRVFLYPSHDSSSIGRALNYWSFFLSAFIFCLLRARRFDAIYVYHPPITVGLAAAISGLFTRRPFVLEVQDLWPESVATSRMGGASVLSRILGPICRFVYCRAAVVLGQSRGMTRRLIARGVPEERTDTLFNWANEDAIESTGSYDVAALAFEGRFNFVFGGNMGKVQGLETMVNAAYEAARTVPRIKLTLIGDGVERDRIAALIAGRGGDVVSLRPSVPQSQIGDVFAAADVLILHLIDDPMFAFTIPSKTQFYMAMGKPILIGMRGEAAGMVTDIGAGVAVPPDDVDAMARAMVDMARMPKSALIAMGGKGRAAYWAHYSFESAAATIANVIAKLLNPAPGMVRRNR